MTRMTPPFFVQRLAGSFALGLILVAFFAASAPAAPGENATIAKGKALYSTRKAPRTTPQLVLASQDPFPPTVYDMSGDVPRQPRTVLTAKSTSVPSAPTPVDFEERPTLVVADNSQPTAPPLAGMDVLSGGARRRAQSIARTENEAAKVRTVVPADADEQPIVAESSESTRRLTSTPLVFPTVKAEAVKSAANLEDDEIDQFNARLAKIQLEKKNLDETLRLIDRIKSPNFKVKTLVDLAEYVSRDDNYKREADQLYKLAIDGIDALGNNKPVVVLTSKIEPKQPEPKELEPAKTTVADPPKRAPTLIDLGREIPAKPKEDVPAKPIDELPTLDVEPKKPVDELPTLDVEPKKPVDELPTLDVEPKKPVDELPTLDVEPKKPVDELPTLDVEPKKPVDAPKPAVGPLPTLPKLAPEFPSGDAQDSGRTRRRPPLTLPPEDESPAMTAPEKPTATEAAPDDDAPKADEDAPKARRRPMPSGRRTVTLESN